MVRQDRATINSGSPPSCGANFGSDRWLHGPRWVGWLVRHLDIYLFYVYDFDHDGILTLALVRVGGGGAVPRLVVVEWQTLAAVRSGRVVLALADEALVLQVLRRSTNAVAAMSVALAPA